MLTNPTTNEEGISEIPPTDLVEYNHRDTVTVDDKVIPGFTAKYYKKDVGPHEVTMGVYRDASGSFAYRSWGIYGAENCCRFHQVMTPEGKWSRSIPGGPEFRVLEEGDKVVGLAVATPDGERTFDCPTE